MNTAKPIEPAVKTSGDRWWHVPLAVVLMFAILIGPYCWGYYEGKDDEKKFWENTHICSTVCNRLHAIDAPSTLSPMPTIPLSDEFLARIDRLEDRVKWLEYTDGRSNVLMNRGGKKDHMMDATGLTLHLDKHMRLIDYLSVNYNGWDGRVTIRIEGYYK